MKPVRAFVACALVASSFSAAEPMAAESTTDTSSNDTILVTAARRPQASGQVPDEHQVISVLRERENSSKTAFEILANRVPARFSDYGGGSVKNISLRGAGSERTLVLVDGLRIGTGDQALQDLGDLSDAAIERIEVVEGGQSALYGMDAVGGVVNIITRQPRSEKVTTNLTSSISTYEPRNGTPGLNSASMSGTVGQKRGPVGWLFGVDATAGDGRFEYADSSGGLHHRENDSILDRGFFGRFDLTMKTYSISANAGFRLRNCGSPGMTSWPLVASTRKNIGYGTLSGTWKATNNFSLTGSCAFDYNGVRYIDRTVSARPDTSTNDWSTLSAECLASIALAGQKITAGVSGMRKAVASNKIIVDDTSSLQAGMFASAVLERTLADFILNATPAVRFDYTSVFGSAPAGKCGLMATWNRLFRPALFFTIANSFRSPTLSDLYWNEPGMMVGNPNLRPERGWNWDAGLQARFRSEPFLISARASRYEVRLTDMLAWQNDANWVFHRVNIAAALIKGYSFRSALSVQDKFFSTFEFVYNDARDHDSKKVLPYRPTYMVTYSNSLDLGRVSAGIATRYASAVFTGAANTKSLPPALTLDANAGFALCSFGQRGGLRVVYDVLNLTNEQRYANDGFPLPGREHRVGIRVVF